MLHMCLSLTSVQLDVFLNLYAPDARSDLDNRAYNMKGIY